MDRHGCRVIFGDSRTNRSRNIQAAHFVMDDERGTKVNAYSSTPFDVLPENRVAYLLPTSGVCRLIHSALF